MSLDREAHWDLLYRTRASGEVSWYQAEPEPSLRRLTAAGLTPTSAVIDVGGGDSRLVDRLLAMGLDDITVLDVSEAALARARKRIGEAASRVTWIAADVTSRHWTCRPVDFWHDRAVFHFLTERADRERYVARLGATLKPGGTAVLATFAADGPLSCSGLPIVRYSADELATTLGSEFQLVSHDLEDHVTPTGAHQRFQWCVFTTSFVP